MSKLDREYKERMSDHKSKMKASEEHEAEKRRNRQLQEKQIENTAVREGRQFLDDFASFKLAQLDKMNENEKRIYHADLEMQKNLVMKY